MSLIHDDQERSSSKRKEMWRTVQIKANNGSVIQLILDMKVRWSSTYLMLDRAERKKAVRTKVASDNSYSLFTFFCSVLINLLMNCDGKKLTPQSVIRCVS